MTPLAPRIVLDVSCVMLGDRCNIWCCWRVTLVAPRIAMDVSCVIFLGRCNLVVLAVIPVAPRIVVNVSCVTRIEHEYRSYILFCMP